MKHFDSFSIPRSLACTPFTLCFHLLLRDILENEAAMCISLADRRIIKLINRGWIELSVKGVGRSSLLLLMVYYHTCIESWYASHRMSFADGICQKTKSYGSTNQLFEGLALKWPQRLWWNFSLLTKFPIFLHIICIHAFNRLLCAW